MASCSNCGRSLGMADRIRGRTICQDCERAAEAKREAAFSKLTDALSAAVASGNEHGPEASALAEIESDIGDAKRVSQAKTAYYQRLLDAALADDRITVDEEARIDQVAKVVFGDDDQANLAAVAPYRAHMFIAMVNDGRAPQGTTAPILLKKGEVVHLVENVSLLKEVVQREFRAGSRGYSFRIAKGVSYRVGSTRGQVVEVGRSIVDADQGDLIITSQRAVFTGMRRTIEMPYTKLIDLNVYSDAIQFQLSGRANPPMFRVSSGPMFAAAVNAAAQKLLA